MLLRFFVLAVGIISTHSGPSQPYYSEWADQGLSSIVAFPKVTRPAHPADQRISELIGGCSCPAMKTACDPLTIYRENPKIVKVQGERKTVYLNREVLREIPIRKPVVLDKDYSDVQRLTPAIISQPVECINEVLREEIEYYDVVVERVEIQYNDIIQKVILDVEEPDIVEDKIQEPVRVSLREETLSINIQPETIWLTEEIANQINDTITVQQKHTNIRGIPDYRTEVIQCDSYKVVKIPRDDCAQPRLINGYLPAP